MTFLFTLILGFIIGAGFSYVIYKVYWEYESKENNDFLIYISSHFNTILNHPELKESYSNRMSFCQDVIKVSKKLYNKGVSLRESEEAEDFLFNIVDTMGYQNGSIILGEVELRK